MAESNSNAVREAKTTGATRFLVVVVAGLAIAGIAIALLLPHTFDVVAASLWGAFANPVTWLVCIVLVAAMFPGLRLHLTASRFGKRLQDTEKQLDRIRRRDAQVPSTLGDVESALGLADEVVRRRGDEGPVLAAFREFEEHLVTFDDRLHNEQQASAFFDDESMLAAVSISPLPLMPSQFRYLHILPNLLTGAGLLGTFAGIAMGLGEISALSEAEASAVSEGIGGVIVGLSSAFWTSIFGLFSGLVFSYLAENDEARITDALTRIREHIDRIFPRLTAEQLLLQQHVELRETRRANEESSNVLKHMAENLADAVERSLTSRLEPLIQQMMERMDTRGEEVAQASIDGARGFVDEMVGEIGGSLERGFSDMSESVNHFTASFDSTQETMGSILENVRTLAEELASVTERSSAIAEQSVQLIEAQESVVRRQEESANGLLKAATEMKPMVSTLATVATSVSDNQDRLAHLSSTIQQSLSHTRAAAEEVSQMSSNSREWASTMTTALETYGEQITGSLKATLVEYDHSLAKAVASLSATVSELEELASALAEQSSL